MTKLIDYQLEGKTAIVTGASKGIGFAIASGLCRAGANVVMVSRDKATLNAAAERIRNAGGQCVAIAGSVTEPSLPEEAISLAEETYGAVDILINNAGGPPMGNLLEHELVVWEQTLQTNLMSVVRFTRAVLPTMLQRKWGRIVSISSTVAKEPSPAMILSATARAGVAAFSKSLSREVAESNITVNVICPGGVRTERMVGLFEASAKRSGKSLEEVMTAAEAGIPAKRFAEPEEMAGVCLFLCSAQGGYMNGLNLSVDGGLTQAYT